MLKRFRYWKDKEQDNKDLCSVVAEGEIPKHVAIIMDGNGRWAKKRNLPRVAGHKQGMETVKQITKAANALGVKVLTLYAFSTENWKRPKKEVEFLMKLPEEFMGTFLPELIKENVVVKMMGNTEELPSYTYRAIEKAVEETKHNTGLVLNFALNYGSRNEITQAVQQIASACQAGEIKADEITDETISNYLLTKDYDDPELLIRTSGELRISNFLLWQIAYSELYFTDVFWPDFSEEHFVEAIAEYQQRNRRYGGL
ncbi:MAG: isoprenyl transferase [Bacillaceae bacterium]